MPTTGTSGSTPAVSGGDEAVRVFMSYRRTDDANFTGRFHDKLIGTFGDANVFRDIDSIPAGTRFEDVINDRLAGVDAVLALIGPTWGGRIGASSDFVRMEIAQALQSGTPVIPVLIEDTPLPTRDELPDDLKPLLDHQTVRVRRDPDFHRDAARVIDGVREAVLAEREREAERRKVEEQAAERRREEEQRRAADEAKRREIEAELAVADARANDKRLAAQALAAERASRLAELTRLEEEMTQRKIADERARIAEIVESQTARERDAASADARAAELRRELAALGVTGASTAPIAEPPQPPPQPEPEPEPEPTAETVPGPHVATTTDELLADELPAEELPAEELPAEELVGVEPVLLADVPAAPTLASPPKVPAADTSNAIHESKVSDDERPAVAAATDHPVRRKLPDAAKAELVGGVLLLVAVALAIRSLLNTADGANSFDGPWSTDIVGLILTAALLLPVLAFYYGNHVPAVTAGASIGWLAYQGLPDAYWFWSNQYDEPFPTDIVVVGIVLGSAWFAFRRGNPLPRAMIDHAPSRYLQVGAAVAGLLAMLYFASKVESFWDPDAVMPYVWIGVSVLILVLAFRRGQEATLALSVLAAECALEMISLAIGFDDFDRAFNVAAACIVVAGTAFWRARRAVEVTPT